jgi:hypothetical protein
MSFTSSENRLRVVSSVGLVRQPADDRHEVGPPAGGNLPRPTKKNYFNSIIIAAFAGTFIFERSEIVVPEITSLPEE